MPTVPTYDVPTQELANVQLNTFQAPNVQPMADITGKQIDNMGKATMGAAAQIKKTADSIVDEIHDANIKAQDTAFLGKMQDILYNDKSGFMWQKGINAKDALPGAQEAIQKAVQESKDSLQDPVEQAAFGAAAQRHLLTFNQTVIRHAGEQVRVYAAGESEAREGKYVDMAIANFGNKDFKMYLNTALAEADARAEMVGAGAEGRDAMRLKATTKVYGSAVTNLMLNNRYTEARTVLDQAQKDGLITEDASLNLNRALIAGYDREQGKNVGDSIYNNRGPAGTDSNSVINYVRTHNEGSAYVENDAGKGPTKHGINASAYFGVDAKDLTEKQINFIKNLSPEKADEIYKKNYWDAIKADSLPPEMRAIAFDGAVNQGVGWTKGAIEKAMQSDNPAQTLIDLRRERYDSLVKKNPELYGQYAKSWNNRLNAFQAGVSGESSLAGMLAQTDGIENKEQRDIARARVKQLYAEDKQVKEADYHQNYVNAQDIAFKREGGWQDVPAPMWAQLKQEDRAKLMVRPKGDDPDTVLNLNMNPDLWKAGSIEKYRPLLSESTYNRYYTAGNGPDADNKLVNAKIDSEQFENQLVQAGIDKFIGTPKDLQDKKDKIQLKATLEDMISAEQIAKKRTLTPVEKNELTKMLIRNVKVNAIRSLTPSWFGMDQTTMDVPYYKVQNKANIIIPEATQSKITRDLKTAGTPNPSRADIISAYLHMTESE